MNRLVDSVTVALAEFVVGTSRSIRDLGHLLLIDYGHLTVTTLLALTLSPAAAVFVAVRYGIIKQIQDARADADWRDALGDGAAMVGTTAIALLLMQPRGWGWVVAPYWPLGVFIAAGLIVYAAVRVDQRDD